jgi:TetR/AcrR family transcriptional regulator, transcriptional repressor for nem operon
MLSNFFIYLCIPIVQYVIMSETKEYIIDQAYGLFLSKSYEAVSISDISKSIGFTKGALYHHFTNKEELFKAVIDKYVIINEITGVNLEITLAQYIELSLKKTREIVESLFNKKPDFIPISLFALFIDAFRHYPRFARDKEKLIKREIEIIKTVMDNAIKTGEIRKEVNTDLMAIIFFSLNLGMASNLLQNTPELALNSLKDQLYELYKILKI